MIKKGVRWRAFAIGSAVAACLSLALATSSAASADPMRTLNLTMQCATGEPFGLLVDGNQPTVGSSTGTNPKYFSVSIPASLTTLSVSPLGCDGQPTGTYGSTTWWEPHSITAGTSTINATTYCQDYNMDGELIFDCPISSVSYS